MSLEQICQDLHDIDREPEVIDFGSDVPEKTGENIVENGNRSKAAKRIAINMERPNWVRC